MEILVLGGTRLFGKVLVNKLITLGHNVTIATRGLTQDDFGDRVNRVVLDRDDKGTVEKALTGKNFDVVYDNLCYSPNSARDIGEVLKDRAKKYIMVSSSAVYDFKKCLKKEEDFDPINYEVTYGDRGDFSYADGKRGAEGVLFQNNYLPTIGVRFPVVLDENDYTKRLYSYVESIASGQAINIDNMDCELSFISAVEAGEFLAWLCDVEYEGVINGACNGSITPCEFIGYIERVVGVSAVIEVDGVNGAYNGMFTCSLDTSKARGLGFVFEDIRDVVFGMIDKYVLMIKSS